MEKKSGIQTQEKSIMGRVLISRDWEMHSKVRDAIILSSTFFKEILVNAS